MAKNIVIQDLSTNEVYYPKTLMGNVEGLNLKFTEVDAKIAALEAGTYDDSEVRGLIIGLSNNKADKTELNSYLTKTEASSTYLTSSDIADFLSKTEIESKISTAVNDMATQTWVGTQGFLKAADIAGKLDTSVYTDYIEELEERLEEIEGKLAALPTEYSNIKAVDAE